MHIKLKRNKMLGRIIMSCQFYSTLHHFQLSHDIHIIILLTHFTSQLSLNKNLSLVSDSSYDSFDYSFDEYEERVDQGIIKFYHIVEEWSRAILISS